MRIEVDSDRCIASGACVLAAPAVFAQDGDGFVTVLDEAPSGAVEPQVVDAVRACPASAIWAEE